MTYAVILAGGEGRRFWPLSRQNEPKQFLKLPIGKTMLENALECITGVAIPKENIYVATNRRYHKRTAVYLRKLKIPIKNIFLELDSRNNFAPIGVLSKMVYAKDRNAVILVLPCDNYVKFKRRFFQVLTNAVKAAQKGYIVTLGFTPYAPETKYGYIKINSKLKIQNSKIYKVDRFIEKPDKKRAKAFVKDKRYCWNGGIFLFRADTMLGEIKKYRAKDYSMIKRIMDKEDILRFWKRFSSTSIDYAIMEKTDKAVVIPVDVGWIDLGSWEGIAQFYKVDKCGNVLNGKCIDIGSKNILALSQGRVLATLGLNNIIIVDTKDALLVCAKERAQEVKKLVEVLKQRKLIK